MERADQWGLFIRLVGWWDTTRGSCYQPVVGCPKFVPDKGDKQGNRRMSKVKVYQCFMFLEKNSSTAYHNSSSRLAITRFRELL